MGSDPSHRFQPYPGSSRYSKSSNRLQIGSDGPRQECSRTGSIDCLWDLRCCCRRRDECGPANDWPVASRIRSPALHPGSKGSPIPVPYEEPCVPADLARQRWSCHYHHRWSLKGKQGRVLLDGHLLAVAKRPALWREAEAAQHDAAKKWF